MRTLLIACALLVGATAARAERKLSDGDAAFAAALHGQLRTTEGNLFYSPVSVRMALGMALAGARGTTRTELARALALPIGLEGARAVGAQLAEWDALASAGDGEAVVLRVVNRVWTQRGCNFLEDFMRTLREHYRAPPGTVDFEHDAEGARAAINSWVAQATEQMIPALIGPGQLAADTKMMLTNAVYFKGRWSHPFAKRLTWSEDFFIGGKQTVTARFMHRLDPELIASVSGAQVLELPYGDGRVVMDVVLPTAKDGLRAIEDAYVKGALSAWLKALATKEVELTLPRFKMSSALELVPALRRLGIVHATSPRDADFSGMSGARDFYVGAIIHQAVIDVDELKTEAAAATAIGMVPMMAMQPPPPPIIFRADHPFLFVIRDATSGVVLFAGRVVDPTAR